MKVNELRIALHLNQSDEERKEWESFHLDQFIKEFGLLPPHNRNRGKTH